MAVQARTLHIPAGLPIDESTRPELLPVGQANVQNRNVRSIERGTLEKRAGLVSIQTNRSDGTLRTAGRKLFDHKGRICTYDGDIIDDFSLALTSAVPRNRLPEAHFRTLDLPSASLDARVADSVYCNGFLVILEMRQTGPSSASWEYHTCVVEALTGTVIRSIETVAGPGALSGVALAAYGTNVILGVGSTAFGQFDFSVLDTSSAAGLAAGWTHIATETATSTSGQLAMANGTDRVYAAFDDGAPTVLVRALNGSGVVQSKNITPASAPVTDTICLSEDGDVLWVGWSDSTNVNVIALGLTSITTVVGTVANVFGSPADSLFIVATGTQQAAIATNDSVLTPPNPGMHVRAIEITAGAVAPAGQAVAVSNTAMAARPFTRGSRVYGWFTSASGDSCVLAEWTPPRVDPVDNPFYLRPVVSPIVRGLVDHPANRSNIHARTAIVSSTQMFFAFGVKRTGLSSGALGVVLDFADRELGNSAAHHGVTYLVAGVTSLYDGDVVAEAGFLEAPATPFPDISTSGAVTLTRGGRNYVAIYSWTDAVGNVHLSGVSPTSGLCGNVTSKKIIATISGLALAVERPIDVMLYATVDGGEPPYYFVGATSNDPNNSVTVVDNFDDATLSARAKLFAPNLPGAVGEAQDRRAPTGLRNLISYNGMLVGTVGNTLVFSGQEVSGEGTWFTPIFQVPYGTDDFTGLRSQDGYIAAWTVGKVFTVAGESPSDNGAAGGFGTPRLVCADYGCIEPNSLVATSLGVFLQSDRGIELFTRSQSVEWIGELVLDTLDAYPYVTSAVVDGRNSILRITLAKQLNTDGTVMSFEAAELEGDPDFGGGRDLVFDLAMNSWISIDDRPDQSPVQSAAMIRFAGQPTDIYAILTTDGVVHAERSEGDSKQYRDDDNFVPSQYTTPPMTFGLQQEQRVFEVELTFEKLAPADIVVEVSENYGPFGAITADKVWLDTEVATKTMVPFRPKSHGNAVQFRSRDRDPGTDLGTGRGVKFIGLSSDAAPKQGATRGTTRGNTVLRR